MKAIDNKELIKALEDLEKEKGIKKEYLLESIETALVTAYKRNFDSSENVKVVMDEQTGATHVYSVKEIAEKVENPITQIDLKSAKKINKTLKVGEQVDIEIVPKNFGRIAAQTAKQVIVQKIREAEREVLYTEYSDRKGEIVSGIIQKADRGIVIKSSSTFLKKPKYSLNPFSSFLNKLICTLLLIYFFSCQSFLKVLSIPGDETSKKYCSLM